MHFSIASLGLVFYVCQVSALWPIPVSFTNGSQVLWIDKSIQVTYNGQSVNCFGGPSEPQGSTPSSSQIVSAAVTRTLTTIFTQSLTPWKFYPRFKLSSFEPSASGPRKLIHKLSITQSGAQNKYTPPPSAPGTSTLDESYNLTITADGVASITAVSNSGVIYALESFAQLFYAHSIPNAGIYTNLVPVSIIDKPKFVYRGLNLDISRNYFPLSSVLTTISTLSANKFNTVHLHISDSQSWPLQIPALPDLAAKGSYGAGLTYSPSDLQQIQQYGAARGVEVILEFDMPGHTTSIGYAYPDLITAFDAKPWTTYCNEPPCGQLKLNSSAVYSFLNTLFADVLPRVEPYSTVFHTGGDEVNLQAYLLDETVQSNDTAVITPLLQKFLDRNHDQIRKAGLTPMVWEEMLTVWNLTLGKDVLIQSWGVTGDSVNTITAAGYRAIVGDYNFWYLDCGKGEWIDFVPDSFLSGYDNPAGSFADWCAPYKNWKLIYSYDPLGNLSPAQQALVHGGEIHIWTEQTDPVNLDDMIWPRGSAAGEILWSGQKDEHGNNRTQLDASGRLAEMRERMVNRGVRAGPVEPVFCSQYGEGENGALECSF